MRNKKKVYVAGGMYGCHNIGDEAVLLSTIRTFSPFVDMTVASNNEEWINSNFKDVNVRGIDCIYARPILGINLYPRTKFINGFKYREQEKRFIKSIDAYICGGGTVLSDCPWHSMTLVQYACKYGKPVILWGSGIADGNDERTNLFIANNLNNNYVKRVYLRDETVALKIKNLGVPEEKIKVCYDPAIMIQGGENSFKEILTEKQFEAVTSNKLNVAFCFSGENDIFRKIMPQNVANIVQDLNRNYNCNIFFVPSGCSKEGKDLELINEFRFYIKGKNIWFIDKEMTPDQMVDFLRKIGIVISSRLHVNIFSACGGKTQFIGIVRNSKIIDFSAEMKQPYLTIENFCSENVMRYMDMLLNRRNSDLKYINERVSFMRKKYKECVVDALMQLEI